MLAHSIRLVELITEQEHLITTVTGHGKTAHALQVITERRAVAKALPAPQLSALSALRKFAGLTAFVATHGIPRC
jgi:hypothetical protein